MKMTAEIPDKLHRQAKAEAARRGRRLTDLIEEGLRLALKASLKTRRQRSLAGLTKHARGMIDSGIHNLAADAAFGRDNRSQD